MLHEKSLRAGPLGLCSTKRVQLSRMGLYLIMAKTRNTIVRAMQLRYPRTQLHGEVGYVREHEREEERQAIGEALDERGDDNDTPDRF